MNRETEIDMCKIDGGNLLQSSGSSAWCSVMTSMGGTMGWLGDLRGRGYMYAYGYPPHILHCMAETNTNTVKQLYIFQLKKKSLKKEKQWIHVTRQGI